MTDRVASLGAMAGWSGGGATDEVVAAANDAWEEALGDFFNRFEGT